MLRVIGAALVWFFAYAYTGLTYLPNMGPNEGPYDRAVSVAGVLHLCGSVIGFLYPRAWFIALLLAFPISANVLGSALECIGPEEFAGRPGTCGRLIGLGLVNPLVALVGGFWGAQIGRWISERDARAVYGVAWGLSILVAYGFAAAASGEAILQLMLVTIVLILWWPPTGAVYLLGRFVAKRKVGPHSRFWKQCYYVTVAVLSVGLLATGAVFFLPAG